MDTFFFYFFVNHFWRVVRSHNLHSCELISIRETPISTDFFHFFTLNIFLFTSLKNIALQNSAYYFRKSLEISRQNPWSNITIWKSLGFFGWGRMKTLPGWGSQCTNPVIKIWSAKALMSLFIIFFLLYPRFLSF